MCFSILEAEEAALRMPSCVCFCHRMKMSNIQLLRDKVSERLTAAVEELLQRLEAGETSAEIPALRALVTQRLAEAAEEIVALFQKTVAELEERAERSEGEVKRRRKVWDALQPQVRLQRSGG